MRNITLSIICTAAAILIAGCAKESANKANEAEKRFFDAWMLVNYPNIEAEESGIYIVEESIGDGEEVKEDGYALVDYIIRNLEGDISSYTDKETAKQLGEYDTTYYYGAKFQSTKAGALAAGVSKALIGMKVGGYKKVVIPSWLMSNYIYETEEEYLENVSGGSSAIYEIRVKGFTEDVSAWQIGEIGAYFAANQDIFEGMSAQDSIASYEGCYYKQLSAPTVETEFPDDTTIYINYTGKLLNGSVFDTTIERTAKDHGIWSSSKTYEPVKIKWGEEYTSLTMGSSSSSVIDGFALTLWQMKANEKGIGVFTSDYGYGSSGSGKSIPGYAPLIFEIEIVAAPED